MKKNKLKIQINKPVIDVFTFTITPENTKKWINSILEEETNEWPIRIGSLYTHKNKQSGLWNKYTVTDYEEYKVFELTSKDKNYHVRYSYKSIDSNTAELEYYEWVDKGELDEPFTIETLKKLKTVLEN